MGSYRAIRATALPCLVPEWSIWTCLGMIGLISSHPGHSPSLLGARVALFWGPPDDERRPVMVIRRGEERVPDVLVAGSNYVACLAVSLLLWWIVRG